MPNSKLITATRHHREGRYADAEKLYLEILHEQTINARVLMALGHLRYQRGQLTESIACLAKACEVEPGDADNHLTLANLLAEAGKLTEALTSYQQAILLRPGSGPAWLNLGVAHYHNQNFTDAIKALSTAIQLDTHDAKAFYNLGLTLMQVGRATEADPLFRRACEIEPDNAAMHTSMLFNLHNLTDQTSQTIFDAHLCWAARFAAIHPDSTCPPAHRHNGRARIRVGYLSPDFRTHSVFYFIHPVLKAHDRTRIECYCYSDVSRPDACTRELMGAADHWRDISVLDDDEVFRLIRQDGIEILVDLAGHTDRNRLRMLSRRPAPVQTSWLGYPATTGLETMDYRFTDAQADPEGMTERFHTEKLVRLRNGFLCYEPPALAPTPGNTPALRSGLVTFGSFNSLAKINDQVIHAWSEILRGVEHARLVLKARGLGDPSGRARILSGFRRHGIGEDRIECLGHRIGMADHLSVYQRIDIALDTFPYNGTTTTCEALWMGVPVVTYAGDRHASRVGVSLLTSVGLTECLAPDREGYVELSVRLAGDVPALDVLRNGLRERMHASPLMDAKAFCQTLENQYAAMLTEGPSG
jgi:predicted O-linked N-acetylglucosamine transferase (SPINDLY family)